MSTPEMTLAPWSLDAARRLVAGRPTEADGVGPLSEQARLDLARPG